MVRPTVFISHSTEASVVDPYVAALDQGLTAGDEYEVLLDRERLRASDDWNARIVNWLASCHAAVVVFSPRALSSDYVKFEVGNLFARWQRHNRIGADDEFVFCGILPRGVDPDQLRSGYYGAIKIPDVQLLKADTPEDALAGVRTR